MWKYIRCGDGEAGVTEELYDLARDPRELDNVIARTETSLLASMRYELDQRFSMTVNHCRDYECQ